MKRNSLRLLWLLGLSAVVLCLPNATRAESYVLVACIEENGVPERQVFFFSADPSAGASGFGPILCGAPGAGVVVLGTPDADPIQMGTPDTDPIGMGSPDADPIGMGTPDGTPIAMGTPDADPIVMGTPGTGRIRIGTPGTDPIVRKSPLPRRTTRRQRSR